MGLRCCYDNSYNSPNTNSSCTSCHKTAAAGGEDPAAVKAAALHLVLHCSKCPSWRNCQREYLTERRFSYPEVLVASASASRLTHSYLLVTATDPIRSGL